MSWIEYHSRSEQYASAAEIAAKAGDAAFATEQYRLAAVTEAQALEELAPEKNRTRGITAVSAAALWMKAEEYKEVELFCLKWLGDSQLSEFAKSDLRDILQSAWGELRFRQMGINFSKGDLLVSLKGGEVLPGAAPLDLVHRKEDGIRNIFFRVIEMLLGKPPRRRGNPPTDVTSRFVPWLFQAAPGSYQFAVRIQRGPQMSLFPEDEISTDSITEKLLEILGAAVRDPEGRLTRVVPDIDYRKAFLRLTRDLAPTGKSFRRLEISPRDNRLSHAIVLGPDERSEVNQSLQQIIREPREETSDMRYERLEGILRAVHLDKDWIEVQVNNANIRVDGAGEAIDDIVGPMVNHKVFVDVIARNTKYFYQDIQLDE